MVDCVVRSFLFVGSVKQLLAFKIGLIFHINFFENIHVTHIAVYVEARDVLNQFVIPRLRLTKVTKKA